MLLVSMYWLSSQVVADEPPVEWIDADTGHRVVRLSREPESLSLYFHQYPFSADGKQTVITTPQGLSAVNLETREIKSLVTDPVLVLVTGRKTGNVYYILDNAVHAVSFETGKSRKVADLPLEYRWPEELENRNRAADSRGRNGDPAEARLATDRVSEARRRNRGWGNVTVNADETMLVGVGYDPEGKAVPRTAPEGQPEGGRLGPSWSAGHPRVLYTIDIATGETKVIHRSNDWLNHLQCSPTDPQQILFCHEGPWHYVDRTWIIRTDGTGLTQVHPRTIDMEIGGHEFFSPDGRTVWYDLQTPRSMVSGSPDTTSPRVNAPGITWSGASGRSITTSHLMASSFLATAEDPRRWQISHRTLACSIRPPTVSGCICSDHN